MAAVLVGNLYYLHNYFLRKCMVYLRFILLRDRTILKHSSLHKCMVDFWFILLQLVQLNGTIPKHYLSPRESVRSIQVL